MLQRYAAMAALAGAVLMAGSAAAQQVQMRVSHQLPPGHHIAKLTEQWAADLKARSGGRMDVQILGANQAFKPEQNHAAVARGQVEAALSVNFQWGNTIPEMNLVTIPYFLTDLERIKKFPDSEAAKLLNDKLMEKGVRNVAWFYTTRQSIFTSSGKPLVRTDDFKGVKIRGLNKLVDAGLVAAGAAPSSMPGSEVYNALQTRVIDAGLTDVSAAYSRKFFEVQQYGTVAPFFTVYFHMYVNPAWHDKLPADLKKALAEASAKAEQDSIPLTEKTAEDAVKQLRDKGMTLHIQTPEEAKAFKAVMQPPVIDAFKASSPDAAKLIDLANKL
ncbi:MAG: TRAP transporter substrate-binding protein DctP [Alphaproteobacteria bacterium]|nr:TRAP transporter substrate-binding protein DctP [Alphaproteobacteria bacterium]